jgi:hypothetical protein
MKNKTIATIEQAMKKTNQYIPLIVKVTPEIATWLLQFNTDNRNLKPTVVNKLTGAMGRGEWKFNGEPISFRKNGKMANGQHRCYGIIKSGIACLCLILTGLDDDAFSTIDRGAKRTVSDVSDINKFTVGTLCFFHNEVLNHSRMSAIPTVEQLVELYQGKIKEKLDALHEYAPRASKTFAAVTFKAATILNALKGNQNYAFDMYRKLVLGNYTGLSPICLSLLEQGNKGLFETIRGKERNTTFAKGYLAFDPSNQTLNKLIVHESTVKKVMEES